MREVVPIRLSDQEREQIAAAAGRLELTLSGFVRQAALQASAVERKAAVYQVPGPGSERRDDPVEPSRGVVFADNPAPQLHMVDGEWVAALGERLCRPL